MKSKYIFNCIVVLFFLGCSNEQDYLYIQVDEREGISIGKSLIEKDPEIISAGGDSIAYLEAFRKFTIAVKVNADMRAELGKTHATPKEFKLINPDGKNIVNQVSFFGKDSLEKDIIESILSLGNTYPESLKKSRGDISEKEFGDKWPLTIPNGRVICIDGVFVVFVGDGRNYAINGTARSVAKKNGWIDLQEIWKDDPQDPERKISISPILDKGLQMCR